MGLVAYLERLIGLPPRRMKSPDPTEQLVFITIPIPADAAPTTRPDGPASKRLQEELQRAIGSRGHSSVAVTTNEVTVYLHGADADALWGICEPVIRTSPLAARGHVLRRYGHTGAREVQTIF